MDVFVVLLRAVNVGGTGKLTMAEFRARCAAAGFADVRTIGASGNAVLRSDFAEPELRARIEVALGGGVGVLVRRVDEVAAVLAANPFPGADPSRVMAIFTNAVGAADPLAGAAGHAGEEVRVGPRCVFVFYPDGAGASRLRLPVAREGTARNMNTLEKLVAAGTK